MRVFVGYSLDMIDELTERLVESLAQDIPPDIISSTGRSAAAHRAGKVGRS
jgi:hypothetical protein